MLLLPLAIAVLRLVAALFERAPALDELLLASAIAIVCATVLLIEVRRHRSKSRPEEPHER